MSKSGRQYAQEVRELRAAGIDAFPAANGYRLADAANWSSGQKSAVTRAYNRLSEEQPEEFEEREIGLSDQEVEQYFDSGYGDDFEEWDDIDFFDFAEAEELLDEEADDYEEEGG